MPTYINLFVALTMRKASLCSTTKTMSPNVDDDEVLCYSNDGLSIVCVPRNTVVHMPHRKRCDVKSPHKLFGLCRDFYNTGTCSKSAQCKYIHTVGQLRTVHSVHVNFAWRHESLCTYQRLPAGEALEVLAPNNRPPAESIPSEHILVTKGSLSHRSDALSHCAHFYYNRLCYRGEHCSFVHCINLNPTAEDGQRAPSRKRNEWAQSLELTVGNCSTTSTPVSASSSTSSEFTTVRHNPYGDAVQNRIRKRKETQTSVVQPGALGSDLCHST